jgi:hypothetical protein
VNYNPGKIYIGDLYVEKAYSVFSTRGKSRTVIISLELRQLYKTYIPIKNFIAVKLFLAHSPMWKIKIPFGPRLASGKKKF